MHSRQDPDHFEMAQLFSADVHEQVFAARIFAVDSLHGVLHRSRKLSIRTAKLFEQHVTEIRIWGVDPNGIHQFFYVMVHFLSCLWVQYKRIDPLNRVGYAGQMTGKIADRKLLQTVHANQAETCHTKGQERNVIADVAAMYFVKPMERLYCDV